MKRIRKAAKITSVIVAAILTALVVTVLCAPEEDRIEFAELFGNLDKQEDSERQIDWEGLPNEVIAWVEVPGTNIDEPIVQATPNAPNAYLYKDALGQGNYGTPYIDCECSIDSRFVMVYGHHMSDESVFADFASFIDETYAREHNKIIVYRREGSTLHLEPVAIDVVNASRETLVIDQKIDFKESISESELVLSEISESLQLFAFTTCSYQTRNSRIVVYTQSSSSYLNAVHGTPSNTCSV